MTALIFVILSVVFALAYMGLLPGRVGRYFAPAVLIICGFGFFGTWWATDKLSWGAAAYAIALIAFGTGLATWIYRRRNNPSPQSGPVAAEDGVLRGRAIFRQSRIKRTRGILELEGTRLRFRGPAGEYRFERDLSELQSIKFGSGYMRFTVDDHRYWFVFTGVNSRDVGGRRRAGNGWKAAVTERLSVVAV